MNDQLARLRLLFGDPRVAAQFTSWSGRPARFARYTSRTLYPGVRTVKKDSLRLKSIETFYITLLEAAENPDSAEHEQAAALVSNLQKRGKWPSKPELQQWFGKSGARWKNRAGEFVRAVLRPEDAELLTRHEVLQNPPDILVTNYSMLEYTLMRPLERPIYDATRQWLTDNPDERILLIVDEAHMYRGAAGAEVGLLLRRLRARLAIPAERLQVICTSASFKDPVYAREFAAQLVGKSPADFQTIQGDLAMRDAAAVGTAADARALADVPLSEFYDASDEPARLQAVQEFLNYRGVDAKTDECGPALYEALQAFPPMNLLINVTMQEATPLEELGRQLFPDQDPELADRAVTSLIALGSASHRTLGEPGLLPCRIHAFFRGLPGLWACLDPDCAGAAGYPGSPVGAIYSQPRATCSYCAARVFELYTCRNCGTAYARAYTDNVQAPRFLWNEPGSDFLAVNGHIPPLFPIDLLLEEPTIPTEPADLDLTTGGLNPVSLGERSDRYSFARIAAGSTATIPMTSRMVRRRRASSSHAGSVIRKLPTDAPPFRITRPKAISPSRPWSPDRLRYSRLVNRRTRTLPHLGGARSWPSRTHDRPRPGWHPTCRTIRCVTCSARSSCVAGVPWTPSTFSRRPSALTTCTWP